MKNLKNKIIYIILLIFISNSNIYSQKEYDNNINKYDDKNNKHGYWIEKNGNDRQELYYNHGKKSGVYKLINESGNLYTFGEYKDDDLSGTWFYFGNKGHLLMIQKNFMPNDDYTSNEDGEKYKYKHRCYTETFYPNGVKKSEGILLWNDDPEMDDVREYKEWKYYDENGILQKTENYK